MVSKKKKKKKSEISCGSISTRLNFIKMPLLTNFQGGILTKLNLTLKLIFWSTNFRYCLQSKLVYLYYSKIGSLKKCKLIMTLLGFTD